MDNHSLVRVARMLHRVHSTIVNGECWLIETPRKSYPFNLAHERRLRDLVQCFAHSIVSQAFARWALIPTFMMVLLVIGDRLTGWDSCPTSITNILFIISRNVRVGGGSLLL